MKLPTFPLLYFLLVFAFGFVFGIARALLLEPRVGAAGAELIETPIMITTTYLVAGKLVRKFTPCPRKALFSGLLALAFLLIAEFAFVLQVRGIPFGDYYESRSPLSLSVYAMSLVAFALMPYAIQRKVSRDS